MSETADGADAAVGADASRRRRRWPWVLLAVVVVVVAIGAWLAFGVLGAARTIQAEASDAQTRISRVQDALTQGDYVTAKASADAARESVTRARQAADGAPLRVLSKVPVVSGAVDDVDNLIGSAEDLSRFTDQLVNTYGSATGKRPGSTRLFRDGAVDLRQAAALSGTVATMQATLDAADAKLHQVKATLPGTGVLATARDEALAKIAPVRDGLATAKPIVDQLPALLGAKGPKRYLTAILNPAELRASGGAPLSLAVMAFTGGKLSVPVIGSTAQDIFPGNPLIVWDYAGVPPFVPKAGEPGRFVNSTFNPDLRMTGPNITRAWVAGGRAPVDGVLMIDTTALEALLRETGPVSTEGYGQVTADNFRDKVLVNAYREYTANDATNAARRSLNLQLAQVLLNRLVSGDKLVATIRALSSVAPGRHAQAWFPDPAVEKAITRAGFDGEVSTPKGDHVAVFSQNGNQSKVDIFQRRTVTQTVQLRADGGADVVQSVNAVNDSPTSLSRRQRTGYLTAWSRNAWYLYLPSGAKVTAFQRPRTYTDATVTDSLGRTLKQTIGWIAPRSNATITLRYSLPTGRFGGGDALRYTLTVNPQAVWPEVTFRLRVLPPKGWTAIAPDGATTDAAGAVTWTTPLDRTIDVVVAAQRG